MPVLAVLLVISIFASAGKTLKLDFSVMEANWDLPL